MAVEAGTQNETIAALIENGDRMLARAKARLTLSAPVEVYALVAVADFLRAGLEMIEPLMYRPIMSWTKEE